MEYPLFLGAFDQPIIQNRSICGHIFVLTLQGVGGDLVAVLHVFGGGGGVDMHADQD